MFERSENISFGEILCFKMSGKMYNVYVQREKNTLV